MRYLADNNIFNVLDSFFTPFAAEPAKVIRGDYMKADMKENENGYEIFIDLPGFKKEDISAEIQDDFLVVTAERKEESNEEDSNGSFLRRERFIGTCRRKFLIGKEIEESGIKAAFEDGVLKFNVPKKAKEEIPSKLITIE